MATSKQIPQWTSFTICHQMAWPACVASSACLTCQCYDVSCIFFSWQVLPPWLTWHYQCCDVIVYFSAGRCYLADLTEIANAVTSPVAPHLLYTNSSGHQYLHYDHSVTYHCYAGFQFAYNITSMTAICLGNQTWSHMPPCLSKRKPTLLFSQLFFTVRLPLVMAIYKYWIFCLHS